MPTETRLANDKQVQQRRQKPGSAPLVLLWTAPLLGLMAASQLSARPNLQTPGKPPVGKTTPRAVNPGFAGNVRPLLDKYCLGCHSAGLASGGLDLTPFRRIESLDKDPDAWQGILRKLQTGQMPPPGSPRPGSAQLKPVVTWLSSELTRRERLIRAEAGRVTARRLNRAEYDNTIRDLLGVDIRPAADFPQDDSGYGFDNIGDVLSLSPPLLEKYLSAAEKVARTAIFGPERQKPTLIQIRMPRRETPPNPTVPREYDLTGLTLPNSLHTTYRFPADARYSLRVVLTGRRAAGAEPMNLGLWIDGKLVQQIAFDPKGSATFPGEPQELAGQTATFPETRITEGEHWVAVTMLRAYEGLPPSFGGPNPSRLPEPAPRFRGPELPTDATPEQRKEFTERQERIARQRRTLANASKLFALEIVGPYDQSTTPPARSQKLLYTCGHTTGEHPGEQREGCAKKILSELARRAFRRPVTPAEVARYSALVSETQRQGDSFKEGLCVAVQAILVSPHFLFRIERDPILQKDTRRNRSHPISDYELASRLSYFLWSTMPDEELLRLAATRDLGKTGIWEAQVQRMLKDPRVSALAQNFAGQWLELRRLESHKPDLDKFAAFDDYLRLSMRRETELFFEHIARQDRSVLDFLDGPYSFLNERMAAFYGIKGVQGPQFRKVDLRGTERGGILTQASVLTVTSYSTRTSPVLRGKWILENLLNSPPPPPPPGVPSLDEARIAAGESLRKQLEEHRKQPLCSSCHSRMDPLGFGLENFDAVGGWRTADGKTPVDASGTLPSGESFRGPAQLKALLKKDQDAFIRCLTEKLLTYALGRGLERADRPTVSLIAGQVKKDPRFSRLVLEIVNSLPFRQRKGLSPDATQPAQSSAATDAPSRHGSRTRAAVSGRHDSGFRRTSGRG